MTSKFVVTQAAVTSLISAANSAVRGSTKLAAALRTCLPAADADPATIEAAWAEVKGSASYQKADKLAQDAIRSAMSAFRRAAGYGVGKDGKITIKEKPAAGEPRQKGESKVPKAEGMTDALAIARVGQLATSFLTADDQKIMARLLSAMDHKMKAATGRKR